MSVLNAIPIRHAVEALEVAPGDHVLELGFGSGRSLGMLAALAKEGIVCGVDQSELMVARATRRYRTGIKSGHIRVSRGGFRPLPWEGEIFDKVLLVNVVYFFDEEGSDISEVYRILRPGGRVALYATDRATMSKWPFAERETHRLYDTKELQDLLRKGGFGRGNIEVRPVSLPMRIAGLLAVATR
jgi:SAM-dependent methyltransferase